MSRLGWLRDSPGATFPSFSFYLSSREGWNITKNLFSEITVLTLGFFLGILDSSIQDFCLLAVMGLLTDFYLQVMYLLWFWLQLHFNLFLQTFFFVTVLAMDISRTGLVDVVERPRDFQRPVTGPGMRRGPDLAAPAFSPRVEVSRRVKLFIFWAQRRVVSRLVSCLCSCLFNVTGSSSPPWLAGSVSSSTSLVWWRQ